MRKNILMFDSTALDLPRASWREAIKAELTQGLFQGAFVSGKRSTHYLRSLNSRSLIIERGYDVVDNGFFASRTLQIREALRLDPHATPFLFVGRLAAAKNLGLLIKAFATYRRQGGKRALEIVGHGPLEASLRILVAKSDLGRSVRFCGFQPYASLPEWYARAGCLILPSASEPWGLVVNEAMACSLPVIVSDRCGCADDLVEDGRNGYIFPASSSTALASRMIWFDRLDERDRKAMGHRSQELIRHFSLDRWAEAVLRLAKG
jgi:glycosyltransferase involved in cell wall biosynthesis